MAKRNQVTVTIKLQRIDLCDLLLACAVLTDHGSKWQKLHDKLLTELDRVDAEIDG